MGNDSGKVLSEEELRAREIQKMDIEMRHKLSKGVQYNMRVLIRGERNTGKTCLFHRLQGHNFVEKYVPTDGIQTCHIHWDYKVTDAIVKVEVWDVVDKARRKKKDPGSLKLGNEDDEEEFSVPMPNPGNDRTGSHTSELDAQTIDVLKGAQAVVMVLDPIKRWTWDYVVREVPLIPKNIMVLILANYRDVAQHRAVPDTEIEAFAKQCGSHVKYLEASMKNCYGLKGVKCFLNIPFLKLQREALTFQLNVNTEEMEKVEEEFKMIIELQDYNTYLQTVSHTRQSKAVAKSSQPRAPPSSSSIIPAPIPLSQHQPHPAPTPQSTSTKTVPSQVSEPLPVPRSSNAELNSGAPAVSRPNDKITSSVSETSAKEVKPSIEESRPSREVKPSSNRSEGESQSQPVRRESSKKGGFFSRILSAVSGDESKNEKLQQKKREEKAEKEKNEDVVAKLREMKSSAPSQVQSIDHFIPGGEEEIDDWFKDENPNELDNPQNDKSQSDDEDRGNPYVAADEDSVSIEEPVSNLHAQNKIKPNTPINDKPTKVERSGNEDQNVITESKAMSNQDSVESSRTKSNTPDKTETKPKKPDPIVITDDVDVDEDDDDDGFPRPIIKGDEDLEDFLGSDDENDKPNNSPEKPNQNLKNSSDLDEKNPSFEGFGDDSQGFGSSNVTEIGSGGNDEFQGFGTPEVSGYNNVEINEDSKKRSKHKRRKGSESGRRRSSRKTKMADTSVSQEYETL
eukprot:TRINITY_DN2401_c0_g1_i2.p1 TRINITY_DN2401_c0_g1~~TRINITY_DN2401_c0_g1_i2.p1  ORF type:complete len:749 (-),score=191.47 TRINITY_DN2401_c0_g1_i2:14-2224(-)